MLHFSTLHDVKFLHAKSGTPCVPSSVRPKSTVHVPRVPHNSSNPSTIGWPHNSDLETIAQRYKKGCHSFRLSIPPWKILADWWSWGDLKALLLCVISCLLLCTVSPPTHWLQQLTFLIPQFPLAQLSQVLCSAAIRCWPGLAPIWKFDWGRVYFWSHMLSVVFSPLWLKGWGLEFLAGCWPEAALSSLSHGHNRATFFFKANKRQSPLSWADVTRWTYWIHMRIIHGSRHLDCIHLGRSICRSHPRSRESTPQGDDTKRRGLPLSVPPQFPGIHPCSVEHLEHMGLILSTIS